MQRLGQIENYQSLSEKEIATFKHPESMGENARLVKFRIISESETALYYALGEKPNADAFQLLTVVPAGFEEIEFYILGTFHLAAKGGEIQLSTFDNSVVYLGPGETESFARLWEREERDPRILEMERIARHNAENLRRQMLEDQAIHEARIREIMSAGRSADGKASSGAVEPVDPGASASSSQAISDDAASAAGGEESGKS
nr:MAG: hypothetical protein [Microvirus sp.]